MNIAYSCFVSIIYILSLTPKEVTPIEGESFNSYYCSKLNIDYREEGNKELINNDGFEMYSIKDENGRLVEGHIENNNISNYSIANNDNELTTYIEYNDDNTIKSVSNENVSIEYQSIDGIEQVKLNNVVMMETVTNDDLTIRTFNNGHTIDEEINWIMLKYRFHKHLHTNRYYTLVDKSLVEEYNKNGIDGFLITLATIKHLLGLLNESLKF